MAPAIVHSPSNPGAQPHCDITVHSGADTQSAAVVVTGEIDLASADALAATLDEQLRCGLRYVTIDLAAVTFLDSTALSMLLDAHKEFLASNGTLTLTGLGSLAARLLRITGLDGVLFIAEPDSRVGRPGTGLRSIAV